LSLHSQLIITKRKVGAERLPSSLQSQGVLIEPITRYEGAVARLMGDAIRSMTKKLLPQFVSLIPLYEQWAADPVLSTKDRRSVESAVKTLRRVA
jgi:hypothetical protein